MNAKKRWNLRLAVGVLSLAMAMSACSDDASDGGASGTTDTTSTNDAAGTATDATTAADATTAGDAMAKGDGAVTVADATPGGDAAGCGGQPKPAKTCCSGDVETSVVCSGSSWGCPSGYEMVSLGDCGKPLPDAGSTDIGSGADTGSVKALPWTAFKISRGWGPCPPGQVCSESWHLGLDGALSLDKKGTKTTSKMAADDLKMLKEWMAKPEFADGMTKGFACKPPPTDIGISFTVYLSGVMHTKTVTGCILTGPPGNIAKDIFDLVTKY